MKRMHQPRSIRRGLLTNIVVMILALGALIVSTTFWASRRTVEKLSATIIGHTLNQAEQKLESFIQPVYAGLRLTRRWGEAGLLDTDQPQDIVRLLSPLMSQHRHVTGVMIADSRGRECMILRAGETWKIRQTRRDQWGDVTHWIEWHEDKPSERTTYERTLDYDPRSRPWYEGAVAQTGQVFWTKPYTFYTTQDPGITAAVAYPAGDEITQVVGFDILLNDISEFTMNLAISTHGSAVIVTNDMEVIGLPRDPRFDDPAVRKQYLLKHPEQLGSRFAMDATRAFDNVELHNAAPVRFVSDGQHWWGQGRFVQLSVDRPLWIGVLVPESDLLGEFNTMRLIIIAILLATLLGAIVRAAAMARRFSEPIENLVAESDRISRGDLERSPPLDTRFAEFKRLADAHERMRQGLKSLLKLERDLQLAREIQQQAMPDHLPTFEQFDLVAWNRPADETGGDVYDVIGYRRDADGRVVLCDDDADGAFFLLADATGHGVGPALSVTQVRAMLRMAVRNGTPMADLVAQLNDQLCVDLPLGRFVTAWLADLRAGDGELLCLSAGQGPILTYRAADGSMERRDADIAPLGVTSDIDVHPTALVLQRGDIHAVISDGIFEAKNKAGEQFGEVRVMDCIKAHRTAATADLLAALQNAVATFTEGAPQDDDQTVILIKRV